MTSPEIRLSSDEVRRHADMVDEAAVMLDEARAGGAYVRASNDSYGLLVGPVFVGVLNQVQDSAIDSVGRASSAIRTLADQPRSMAAAFNLSDAEAARRLGGR